MNFPQFYKDIDRLHELVKPLRVSILSAKRQRIWDNVVMSLEEIAKEMKKASNEFDKFSRFYRIKKG